MEWFTPGSPYPAVTRVPLPGIRVTVKLQRSQEIQKVLLVGQRQIVEVGDYSISFRAAGMRTGCRGKSPAGACGQREFDCEALVICRIEADVGIALMCSNGLR